MGFIDRAKDAISNATGGESADDMGEEWADEIDAQISEEDEEMEPDLDDEVSEEPEVREWDSAYRFAEDNLEARGFSSMMDFITKLMAFHINKSPMYRDRLQNGLNTMDRLTTMKSQLDELKGNNSKADSMQEKAQKLQAANDVVDQAQKLSGQEEAMVQDAMQLGGELVDAIASNATGGGQNQSNVRSNVKSRDGEM